MMLGLCLLVLYVDPHFPLAQQGGPFPPVPSSGVGGVYSTRCEACEHHAWGVLVAHAVAHGVVIRLGGLLLFVVAATSDTFIVVSQVHLQ